MRILLRPHDIHEALELLGQMVEYGATTPAEIEAFLRLRRERYEADLYDT